jgi:hypothetical protein
MQHKSVFFVVISFFAVALIYSPTITFAGEEITGFPKGGVLEQPSTTPTPTPTPSPTLRAPLPTLIESPPPTGNLCKLFPFHPSCKTPTPTPPPFDPTAPMQEGVLEQLQNDQPPLFGRNVPLQGGGVFGHQPAATAIVPPSPVLTPVPPVLTPEPPVPMFGSTLQATPTPSPQFGQITPETQVLPPLSDDSLFPEDGVLEQPSAQDSEEQSSEEDGQVIARDNDGDDDGPVPPECPLTGPIPPDCTMKPKFPEERALE